MLPLLRAQSKKILVIGDLILDHYIQGEVKRISPEAPVPVLFHVSEREVLGGAGNVANNIKALGGDAYLIGVVGDDGAAKQFLSLANKNGINIQTVVDPSRKTSVKTRFLGERQQLLRVDRETTRSINNLIADQLINKINFIIDEIDAIIISDYRKGLLTEEVLRNIIQKSNQLNIPVLIDPKGSVSHYYKGADYIKPNRSELELLTGIKCDTLDEAECAARNLIEKTGSNVLVTLSQDGMMLVTKEGQCISLATQAKEVFDVSGAGDTAIATFAFALSQGASAQEAARFANVASGIAVSKIGTAIVTLEEIEAEISKIHAHRADSQSGPVDLERAKEIREDWRRRGLKVGFTNGCFDLLHPGHISLLSGAAEVCDRLIVALNSDSSVKKLKGESRPIQSEVARAEVIGALAAVDLVIIFNQQTPLEVITALTPDLLVKGADYTEDQIVGADYVRANGGQIVRIDLRAGHSTTALVEKSLRK